MDGEQQDETSRQGVIGSEGNDGSRVRNVREERDSQSGASDNNGSSDAVVEQAPVESSRGRKRPRSHRHTAEQIRELENMFKECPHPDEKQRLELSKRLGMQSWQVKFWFQNRRTQMKSQIEKHENLLLRQENEKLRAENAALNERVRSPLCRNCSGAAAAGDGMVEDHRLLRENARLREELKLYADLTKKLTGFFLPVRELGIGATGFGPATPQAFQPIVDQAGQTILPGAVAMQQPAGIDDLGGMLAAAGGSADREVFLQLALAAMNELLKVAQMGHPMWLPTLVGGPVVLNYEEYNRTFQRVFGPSPIGFVAEATKEVGVVISGSIDLVDTLMDASRWSEMFPGIIVRATTTDIVSASVGDERTGLIQLMNAELQVLSPMVPAREVSFLRFCRRHAEGLWVVVDVSVDGILVPDGGVRAGAGHMGCRLLPSGCIIQDMNNGCCKVTWVVHAEYDETVVPPLYQQLLRSGQGLGARRWLALLQRRCQYLDMLASDCDTAHFPCTMKPQGRRTTLRLADRMTAGFFVEMWASPAQSWHLLEPQPGQGEGEMVRMMARQSAGDPGEPPGLVLSATTTVWLPATPLLQVFGYLRDANRRGEWDILTNGDGMTEMGYIVKGQPFSNAVSVLRPKMITGSQNNMMILQETCIDASGALVIYAPVDVQSMSVVLNGGDPACACLLPSGFAILPDGHALAIRPRYAGGGASSSTAPHGSSIASGSLVTMAFQILVSRSPAALVTSDAVATVCNLLACTVRKIKAALHGNLR